MKYAKKSDLTVIAIIAAIALLFWLIYSLRPASSGAYAEIYYQSAMVKKVNLTVGEDQVFSIDPLPNVVFKLYSDGSIAFIESDCPDKVCIHSGKLSKSGQFAACLPNEVIVKIVSEDADRSDAPDIIVG